MKMRLNTRENGEQRAACSLRSLYCKSLSKRSRINLRNADRSPSNFTTDSKLNGQHFLRVRYARHLKATITPIYTFRLRNR